MSENEKTKFVRVWNKLNTENVKKHLMLVDDLYGSCASCNHLGLNYLKDKTCPSCKTEFKYIASNQKNIENIIKILARMEKEGIKLQMIEREDFNRGSAKDAVDNLFKKS